MDFDTQDRQRHGNRCRERPLWRSMKRHGGRYCRSRNATEGVPYRLPGTLPESCQGIFKEALCAKTVDNRSSCWPVAKIA
jgi:hypothetical protein